MKIGIIGKMCSGKSTLAKKIVDIDNEYEIYSFGNKVKEIANDLFKMDEKDRYILQNIGKSMRKIDEDVWITYLLDQIQNKDKIIIDNVRYKNEIIKLKENGFLIIYIFIDENEQKKRIKALYNNFENHINNLNHNSENVDDLKLLADFEYISDNKED